MNSATLAKYCEELNKKLAGKVEIIQYTGGTLLTAPKMAVGVSTGIADIGFSHCSYSRGRFPVMEINWQAAPRFSKPLDSRPRVERFLRKSSNQGMGQLPSIIFSTSPVNVVQTLSKPVRSLEDLKGLKIRGRREDRGHSESPGRHTGTA